MARYFGYAWRFITIWFITTIALTVYGFARLYIACLPGAERRRAAVARLRGRVLRISMTTLGATFIKLGQVMSSRPDLFEPETIDQLRLLQDKIPPFGIDAARKIVEHDLGRPLAACYAGFDETPVAAASVAQVHRATLPDGTEVAVKVLRPDIREKCIRDGAILHALARMLAWNATARLSDPVGHLDAFVEGIIEQTDLTNEARHYTLFHQNFAAVEGVRFPHVHTALSGPNVLTMDFVRGHKVDSLPQGQDEVLGRRLRLMFFKMCFVDGFVHADLHPGNMVIGVDGGIAVFDVGLVKHLPEDLLDQFVDFSKCVAMGTTADFIVHMKTYHRYMNDVDWDAVERDIGGFIGEFRAQNVAQLEMGQFANRLFALARKHRVRPIPELTLVLAAIVTCEGLGKILNPHVNTWNEMATFLMPVVQQRMMAKLMAAKA